MAVSLNAVRKFLHDSGCIEERSFSVPRKETLYLELVCRMKRGRVCRALLAADAQGGFIPVDVLTELGRQLAPCLGRGWTRRVPPEDPFG